MIEHIETDFPTEEAEIITEFNDFLVDLIRKGYSLQADVDYIVADGYAHSQRVELDLYGPDGRYVTTLTKLRH